MGTLLQLCLGMVYAWSYFQKPLVGAALSLLLHLRRVENESKATVA